MTALGIFGILLAAIVAVVLALPPFLRLTVRIWRVVKFCAQLVSWVVVPGVLVAAVLVTPWACRVEGVPR